MDDGQVTQLARAMYRAIGAIGPSPTNRDGDQAAFAAVYAVLRDFDAAEAVCDAVVQEYVDKHMRVPTLPRTSPEMVIVDGEVLQRPVRRRSHGEYVFVDDEQAWYMAWSSSWSSSGFTWNKQSPFEANRRYFRSRVAEDVDKSLGQAANA